MPRKGKQRVQGCLGRTYAAMGDILDGLKMYTFLLQLFFTRIPSELTKNMLITLDFRPTIV